MRELYMKNGEVRGLIIFVDFVKQYSVGSTSGSNAVSTLRASY